MQKVRSWSTNSVWNMEDVPLYDVPAVCGGCCIGGVALWAYMNGKEDLAEMEVKKR